MTLASAPRRLDCQRSVSSFSSAWFRFTQGLLLLAFFLNVGLSSLSAQTNSRVLHVWVDPHYGNDTQAAQLNPVVGTVYCNQTIQYANGFVDPSNGKPLLHNAWPYRTVTAAIASIPKLPFTSGGSGITWKYAVIHCLPGMYATGSLSSVFPFDSSTGRKHYMDNGLPANGEVFPIRLPNGVSLQGASALNTVFHLEDKGKPSPSALGTSAFVFGQVSSPGAGDAYSGADTFIDSISIVGTHYDGNLTGIPQTMSASAIYLGQGLKCSPTITNCWIFGNSCGLTLDAPNSESAPWHTPVVMNNSFIWNRTGIWNGQSSNSTSSRGLARPILINNILDASIPGDTTFKYPTGMSTVPMTCFEGIASADLTISSPALGDFNAYEANGLATGTQNGGGYNFSFPIVGLPATVVDPTGGRVSPAGPGINISPYTGNLITTNGAADGLRGVLYIRDLIYNGSFGTTITNFDECPGDFRLAPSVALAKRKNSQAPAQRNATLPSALNPLVDRGFNLTAGTTLPITMGNGQTLSNPPGSLSAHDSSGLETWTFDSWDEDCEGFGNPRIWDHPHYATPPGGSGGIDIGADELGGLVVGGYRFATTSFFELSQMPNSVSACDNKRLWYFGPAGHSIPSPYASWPDFSAVGTGSTPWQGLWSFGTPTYYSPTQTDISPHLFGDIHPYWGVNQAANCNWVYCTVGWQYNQYLFLDPGYGVINPPGSYPTINTSHTWIDITGGNARPFRPDTSVVNLHIGYDAWCRANSANQKVVHVFPSTLSGANILAWRYSIESNSTGPSWSSALTNRNLQSFMVRVK